MINTYLFGEDDFITNTILEFEKNIYVIISIIPDTDELDIQCIRTNNIKNIINSLTEKLEFGGMILDAPAFNYCKEAINGMVIFFWIMHNDYGYKDAFQIEFGNFPDGKGEFVLQIKGIASSLWFYAVTSAHGT